MGKIVYDRIEYKCFTEKRENMRKGYYALLLCMVGIIVGGSHAEAKKKPSISAESAVVMDVQSGTILYEKNMDKKQYPASITKVMTALLAIENSSLSETVTYSREAVTNLEINASNMNIKPGEKISMKDSLYGILLRSANEACNGVSEHIAGSTKAYVKMMNQRAKQLGCTGTHFANTNGLWMKNHYTTAHDMALISREAYKNPIFAEITGTKRYNIPKTNKSKERYLYNHHGMLYASTFAQYVYEYCVGGKTGYTSKCRYTLVTYAKKNGMTLVSVIMKAPNSPWTEPNEYTDTTKILNYCFENYKRFNIENQATEEVNQKYLFTPFSSYYNNQTRPLSIEEGAGVVLPKGVKLNQTQKSVTFYDAPQIINRSKKKIGKITYTYDGKDVGGSEIFYETKDAPTLNDSIDMSEWFVDAIEKAKEEPFPWRKFITVVLIIIGSAGVVVLIIWWLLKHREQWLRRNHYKKNRKNTRKHERGYYYHKGRL